jgi:nucleotide-binding universal stress UspA family protein
MNPFESKPIVVPIDLSKAADRALEYATQLTSRPENVIALHVGLPTSAVEPPYMYLIDDAARRQDLARLVLRD